MTQVIVIGAGVVGAAVAYELSRLPQLQVQLVDRQPPAQAATGAALGVLMGIISHKVKGRNWRLRQASLRRYATLIPELEAQLQRPLPYNRQGIVSLCFEAEKLPRWQSLQAIRARQGYSLEIWTPEELGQRCPDIDSAGVLAAIYSPRDGQVDPTRLTQALVAAAQKNGAHARFDVEVQGLAADGKRCRLHTCQGDLTADYAVVAAGLGSHFTQSLAGSVPLGPVLGQAVRLYVDPPLNRADFQPVINGRDIHLVPLGHGDYWVGATVEFPSETAVLEPEAAQLEAVLKGAIAYCPALAHAAITQTWFGLRPRPQGQAAPIIRPLTDHPQIILATGHYRNGVLLAPATALAVRDLIID